MSQFVITTALMESQRERARRAAVAAVRHLAPLALIAAMLAAAFGARLLAIAVSNRESMEAFREALVRIASALSMPV